MMSELWHLIGAPVPSGNTMLCITFFVLGAPAGGLLGRWLGIRASDRADRRRAQQRKAAEA